MKEKQSPKGKASEQSISGIHHVTAIASDPQRNLDVYTEVLGIRLVKRTVNFEDPGSYHLYFGERTTLYSRMQKLGLSRKTGCADA